MADPAAAAGYRRLNPTSPPTIVISASVSEISSSVMSNSSRSSTRVPFARRFVLSLDGVAPHVIAGHLTTGEARELAMTTLKVELGPPAAYA